MKEIDSYSSTYEKRFRLPDDEVLRERLESVQHIVRDLKREYPEVLSYSVYGSMVKGTAHLESDIDGTLFIDVTPTGDDIRDKQILKNVQSGQYLQQFKRELQDTVGLTPEQIEKDVRQEKISRDDVDTAAEVYLLAKEIYAEELKLWEGSKRLVEGKDPGPFGINSEYEYTLDEPHAPHLKNNITALFNLDVGGGIRKYRKDFLESLERLTPEQADIVCESIYTYLRFTDAQKRKASVNLPKTFQDFKRTYLSN